MADAPRGGERVGPYELVKKLGAGGMGAVWEAVLHGPAGFQKPVALKLLHAQPAEQDRALLIREARLGARLQHPNVVGVLSLGEVDGAWHIAMELVRGASVAELVKAGPLPPAAVVEIGAQAASGLAHVHALVVDGRPAGLVHCDVKPENLLVDCTGLVKVADLGIAALAGETRGAAGTPGFMSPEQVDGRPEPRTDVFALGASLFAIATRKRPFGTGLPAVAALVSVEKKLADPAFLAPVEAAVPGLAAIVHRCLRADPTNRFGSARELAHALMELRARQAAPSDLVAVLQRVRPDLTGEIATGVHGTPATTLVLGGVAGNLPPPRDRFVGREDDVARIVGLVGGGERLVSLLALGGMGKTRLAVEAARKLGEELSGGAWLFDLTEARTVDGVCAAAGAGMSLDLDRTDPVLQVGRALAAKGAAVVVLDNLEQCIAAVRPALTRWLELAPDVRFVCTSRIALRLRGERAVHVGALGPADAKALFLDRAPVPIPDAHQDDVVALCAALEGMPLAIELAAARLRMMTVPQVRRRLADGLGLLATSTGELPDRHRSLEASMRWSWDLLGEGARATLAQLAVFAGGFALEAAEAVIELPPDAGWALDTVQELSEASLVRVDPEAGRLSLLPVVHAFASSRLAGGVRTATEARHGAYYAQLGAPEALTAVQGRNGAERVRALTAEIDNLVAAVRRAVARRDAAVAVPAVLAAGVVIDRSGPFALSAELSLDVLGLDLAPADRARVAMQAGWALQSVGRAEESAHWYGVALEASRAAGSAALEGVALGNVGLQHRMRGRTAEARECYDRAVALLEGSGDREALGRVLGGLGGLFSETAREAEARAAYERSLALRRATGDRRGEAMILANLGVLAVGAGRFDEAFARQQAALPLYREVGDRRGEAQILGDLGLSCAELGRPEEAERHYQAAQARHRAHGNLRFLGIVLSNLGQLRGSQGRFAEAEATLAEALVVHRQAGNRRSEGVATGILATVRDEQGRRDEAEQLLRDALAIHRETGNRRFEASALGRLGRLLGRERADEARRAFADGVAILRDLGDEPGIVKLREDEARTIGG